MTPVPDVEIEIPPAPEFVALVRHVLGATARLGDLSPDTIDNVKLAVSEAATNAVTVSRRAESSEPIQVQAELEPGRVKVAILDRGKPVAPEPEREKKDSDSLDFSFERGLSLPLLEGLVDDLQVEEREGGGSVVRLTLAEPNDGSSD